MNKLKLSRIGAIFYILWGGLHIMLGLMILHICSTEGVSALLAFFGLQEGIQLTGEASNVIGSLGGQHAANLAIFGIIAIIIAFFIPGYIRGMAGVMGPSLFILGAVFTMLGILKNNSEKHLIK